MKVLVERKEGYHPYVKVHADWEVAQEIVTLCVGPYEPPTGLYVGVAQVGEPLSLKDMAIFPLPSQLNRWTSIVDPSGVL